MAQNLRDCVEIKERQKIEHCEVYGANGLCEVCAKDHYLKGALCDKVELSIEECLIYDSKNTCRECDEGFLVTLDQKNCRQILQVNECLSYSLNKCTECNQDSIVDYKYDFEQLRIRGQELTISN